MTAFSLNGARRVSMDFSMELFLIPDQPITNFAITNAKFFEDGGLFDVYHKLDTLDVAAENT